MFCRAYAALLHEDQDTNNDFFSEIPSSLEDTDSLNPPNLLQVLDKYTAKIQSNDINRYNVNRMDIWNCAVRTFKRSSFSPFKTMLVKFSDACGQNEGAADLGGPRREFLRLLLRWIQHESRIVEGPTASRLLRLDQAGL